jgi:hypothetical protein
LISLRSPPPLPEICRRPGPLSHFKRSQCPGLSRVLGYKGNIEFITYCSNSQTSIPPLVFSPKVQSHEVSVSVSGDTVVVAAVTVSIRTSGGGGTNLPPVAFWAARERRIVICFDLFSLSSKVNLHARIASGTDDRGHCNKKATVCAMRTSTRRPLPDMFRKIFAQWVQSFCP